MSRPPPTGRHGDAPIGLIPVDALYSPVRPACLPPVPRTGARLPAYKVENTRVGQELDYDKLTLTIETDGTVTPEDAIGYAARILQDQLQLFVHFDEAAMRTAATPAMIGAPAMAVRIPPVRKLPPPAGNEGRLPALALSSARTWGSLEWPSTSAHIM